MRNARVLFVLMFLVLMLTNILDARTIRVPEDAADLRAAFRSAAARDTVLVSDGTWTGSSNFGQTIPSRVVLKSVHGNDNCIIDAENTDNSVGIIISSDAVMAGIRIRRTKRELVSATNASRFYINNCVFESATLDTPHVPVKISGGSGTIEFCDFRQLNTITYAGALLATNNTTLDINSCFFTSNTCDSSGGAIFVNGSSELNLKNCLITTNSCVWYGGGIALLGAGTEVNVSFCNISSNRAQTWGGGIYKDHAAELTVSNSIFWSNQAEFEDFGNQLATHLDDENPNFIDIHHCVIEDGEDMDAGWFGDVIINQRPNYDRGREPVWGPSNYYLRQDGPWINAGSGQAADLGMDVFTTDAEITPDEGVVDIGFHYDLILFYKQGLITGTIHDVANDEALSGARILTSLGQDSYTNRNGIFQLVDAIADTIFDVTFSYPGFNDSTLTGIELSEEQELQFNMALLHPDISIDPMQIVANIDSNEHGIDTGFVDITITNSGNGPLTWNSELSLVGDVNVDPWTLRDQIPVGEMIDFERLKGVAFANGYYYVTGKYGTSDSTNKVYVLSLEGAMVDSFLQFSASRNGMLDLAWDGELLWGIDGSTVYGFTPEGELITSWEGPLNTTKYIAWDTDRDYLWITNTTNDFYALDREGNLMLENPLSRRNLRSYGLAYWSDDPDGYQLYFISKLSNDDTGYIYKMNADNGDTLHVYDILLPIGAPASAEISLEMDPYSVNFLCIEAATEIQGGDKVMVYMLAGNMSWMMVEQSSGTVNAQEQTIMTVSLFSQQFVVGQYNGLLTLNHNAEGDAFELPIVLTIRDGSAVPENDISVPDDFAIETTYPNPFNATTSINYTLPSDGMVSLKVYDLSGRKVASVFSDYQTAGKYRVNVNANDWSAGVYLARLEANGSTKIAKLVCVK